jgi:NAD(P) transhydrogenase subunit alpha
VNLASTIPYHASQMYAKNIVAFLLNLFQDGTVRLDLDDPIVRETLLTHEGQVVHVRVRELLGTSEPARGAPAEGRTP